MSAKPSGNGGIVQIVIMVMIGWMVVSGNGGFAIFFAVLLALSIL